MLFGSVHPLKGGEIALYLARSFPEIPLLCLCPDPDSDKIADHLRSFKQMVVQRYAKKISSAFAMARIAVAGSLIDETFGRFAFDALSRVPRPLLEQLRSQSIALYRARFSHTHFD